MQRRSFIASLVGLCLLPFVRRTSVQRPAKNPWLGAKVKINDQVRTITEYDPTTKVVTIAEPFTLPGKPETSPGVYSNLDALKRVDFS